MPAPSLSTSDASAAAAAASGLRVTGRPSDDELAAVVALLRSLAAAPPVDPAPASRTPRPGWTRPHHYTAPGAWVSLSAR